MRVLPFGYRIRERGIAIDELQRVFRQLPQVPMHGFVRTMHGRIKRRIPEVDPVSLLHVRTRLHHRVLRKRERIWITRVLRLKIAIRRIRHPYPVIPVGLRRRRPTAGHRQHRQKYYLNPFTHFRYKISKKSGNRKTKSEKRGIFTHEMHFFIKNVRARLRIWKSFCNFVRFFE